ncbi:MAG TPA: polyphosphate kinase 1 [Cyanobacteria bacterium UBA8156]|nr:polyphosphate kinase 1 [Cyanobacteria bacterium UBA8156]
MASSADKAWTSQPQNFFNRELSWLEFNQRVLREGMDERTPLLERVKFTAIFSTNLDEFFMVRVAGIQKEMSTYSQNPEAPPRLSDDGLTPHAQFAAIRQAVLPLVAQQQTFFEQTLRPALAAAGISLLDYSQLSEAQKETLQQEFDRKLFPVLTPLGFEPTDKADPGHPFPYISNLSLNLAVILRDQGDRQVHFARVKVPRILPRFVPVPGAPPHTFVPLEQTIAHNLHLLFPGMEIEECYPFRITRDAELDIVEDEADDLIAVMKEGLSRQRFGKVVRLEIAADTPPEVRTTLIQRLRIAEEDVYDIEGLMNLGDLMALAFLPVWELRDPPWKSVSHPRLKDPETSIFEVMQQGDFLVHHPYQSFTTTVQRFIEEAAADPDTIAIKQTLYRTSGDSPIVQALIRAAENGKQVAVLIELKARFDEANNIYWAHQLENAGVHVVYGPVQLKTHTKTALVVRREGDRLVRYVHIGTGNYNPKTARFYSDLGLFSCREELGADLTDLFNNLTGYLRQKHYRQLLVAPLSMRDRFVELIQREIQHQRNGYPSYIAVKMNSLVDPEIIAQLYEASQAGVHIDAIVRGVCTLKPGLPSLSETIRVISIIGRFLEHSRIFLFGNGGQEEVYIGSADWMPRNLDSRVEVVTPVTDPALVQELKQMLEIMLADNRQAWELQPDGTYRQKQPQPGEPELSSQRHFMAQGRPEFA